MLHRRTHSRRVWMLSTVSLLVMVAASTCGPIPTTVPSASPTQAPSSVNGTPDENPSSGLPSAAATTVVLEVPETDPSGNEASAANALAYTHNALNDADQASALAVTIDKALTYDSAEMLQQATDSLTDTIDLDLALYSDGNQWTLFPGQSEEFSGLQLAPSGENSYDLHSQIPAIHLICPEGSPFALTSTLSDTLSFILSCKPTNLPPPYPGCQDCDLLDQVCLSGCTCPVGVSCCGTPKNWCVKNCGRPVCGK